MTNKELLISHIDQLSDEEISSLLDTITLMTTQNTITAIPDCPYCTSHSVIRYGHKCGKQRFFCKSCEKTFVQTTHTIMSNSHFPAEVWTEAIKDTVHGNAIDYTAQKIGCSHQTAFEIFFQRHKLFYTTSQGIYC